MYYLVSINYEWRDSLSPDWGAVALFSTKERADAYIKRSVNVYERDFEEFKVEEFLLDQEEVK